MTTTAIAHDTVRVLTGYTGQSKRWIGDPSRNTSYEGGVPIEAVRSDLFAWKAIETEAPIFPVLTADGVRNVVDPNRKGIVRDDTYRLLGSFKSGYRPHQFNDVLVDNVSALLDEPDLGIESAGWAKGGALGWVQVGLSQSRVVAGTGVEYRPFLNAWTSHDGSKATGYSTGARAIICDNMVMGVLRKADYKIKHSVNSGIKLAQAREALGILFAVADDFDAQVQALVQTTVSERQWRDFLDAHVPMPQEEGRARTLAGRTRDGLNQLYRYDERAATWNGTAYGVLSAVNTFNNWMRTTRGADHLERGYINAMTGVTEREDAAALSTLAAVLA